MLKTWQKSSYALGTRAHGSLAAQIVICSIVLLAGAGAAAAFSAGSGSSGSPRMVTANPASVPVTAVAGESWLNHLHRPLGETSMGKTERLGPPVPAPEEQTAGSQPGPSKRSTTGSVVLHGSDLYRMNCQGCHGESGLGAPPEIGSVLDPVRATSADAVMDRMKKVGMNMSRAEAAGMARQSKAALLQRLHDGGQDMPAFPHLSEPEVRSLIAYLKQLAGLPKAEKEQFAVRESPARVGELIVKSTCHTCHSAGGRNPGPQQLLDGAIPPLSMLTARTTRPELVRKVISGAPIVMGTPATAYRGRMPVFYYLSESEAADVYQYLALYPPIQSSVVDPAAAMSQASQAATEVDGGRKALSGALLPNNKSLPRGDADMGISALPWVAGLFVMPLLAGGVFITMHEFKRMSVESAHRKWLARNTNVRTVRKMTVVLSAELGNINPEEMCTRSGKSRATGSGY